MIKVKQTKFGYGVGNCFSACLASILEVPNIDDIPNFMVDSLIDPLGDYDRWLTKNYKLRLNYEIVSPGKCAMVLNGEWVYKISPPCILHCIVNEDDQHAVLFLQDNSIWDPRENSIEIKDIIGYYYLDNSQSLFSEQFFAFQKFLCLTKHTCV